MHQGHTRYSASMRRTTLAVARVPWLRPGRQISDGARYSCSGGKHLYSHPFPPPPPPPASSPAVPRRSGAVCACARLLRTTACLQHRQLFDSSIPELISTTQLSVSCSHRQSGPRRRFSVLLHSPAKIVCFSCLLAASSSTGSGSTRYRRSDEAFLTTVHLLTQRDTEPGRVWG